MQPTYRCLGFKHETQGYSHELNIHEYGIHLTMKHHQTSNKPSQKYGQEESWPIPSLNRHPLIDHSSFLFSAQHTHTHTHTHHIFARVSSSATFHVSSPPKLLIWEGDPRSGAFIRISLARSVLGDGKFRRSRQAKMMREKTITC
jgi:hypothetical protein